MRSVTRLILASCAAMLVAGCASVIHGTNQQVTISSTPTGAHININGQYYGRTPRVLNLRRKEYYVVQLELEGHKPYEITLQRALSPWTLGNVVFGDLIGVTLDAVDGAFYRIHPSTVVATLTPTHEPPARVAPMPGPASAAPAGKTVEQQLLDLKELLDAGVLSPAEYEARRQVLVGRL